MAQNEQLIRLEHAICVATDACFTSGMSEHDVALLSTVRKKLRALPTVDAVPVVRCRKCRWSREQDHREPSETPKQSLICQCPMNHHIPAPWGARLAVDPEHFCSYGERRSDE